MNNLNLITKKINNMEFFSFKEENFKLIDNFFKLNYKVLEEFKNDKRTYVAKILIEDKEYILKKIYINKKIKKFLSFFKKGEALSTFFNVHEVKNLGVNELADILIAGIERKNGIIINEIVIMEYCLGEKTITDENLLKVIPVLNKIYFLGRFHGDCNPGNFILNEKGNIKILDTKLKKMWFGDYRKHYDILTLMKHFKNRIEYPYKKNIFYYFAYMVRQIRNKKRGRK